MVCGCSGRVSGSNTVYQKSPDEAEKNLFAKNGTAVLLFYIPWNGFIYFDDCQFTGNGTGIETGRSIIDIDGAIFE